MGKTLRKLEKLREGVGENEANSEATEQCDGRNETKSECCETSSKASANQASILPRDLMSKVSNAGKCLKMEECSCENDEKSWRKRLNRQPLLKLKGTGRNGRTINSLFIKYFWCVYMSETKGLLIEKKFIKNPPKLHSTWQAGPQFVRGQVIRIFFLLRREVCYSHLEIS